MDEWLVGLPFSWSCPFRTQLHSPGAFACTNDNVWAYQSWTSRQAPGLLLSVFEQGKKWPRRFGKRGLVDSATVVTEGRPDRGWNNDQKLVLPSRSKIDLVDARKTTPAQIRYENPFPERRGWSIDGHRDLPSRTKIDVSDAQKSEKARKPSRNLQTRAQHHFEQRARHAVTEHYWPNNKKKPVEKGRNSPRRFDKRGFVDSGIVVVEGRPDRGWNNDSRLVLPARSKINLRDARKTTRGESRYENAFPERRGWNNYGHSDLPSRTKVDLSDARKSAKACTLGRNLQGRAQNHFERRASNAVMEHYSPKKKKKPEEHHEIESMEGFSAETLKWRRFGQLHNRIKHERSPPHFDKSKVQQRRKTPRTYASIAQRHDIGLVEEPQKLESGKPVGDDWVRKRLCWLFREIPCGRVVGVGRLLSSQKKWIKEEHARQIIDNLVHKSQFARAHIVHKWMQRQPWYKFDLKLNNKLATDLGRDAKIAQARELFDEILINGKVPNASTFTSLIRAYIQNEESESFDEAYNLYNQMIRLHGCSTSSSLQEPLFRVLVSNLKLPEQAEILFDGMKNTGVDITCDMYTSMIKIYGKRGHHEKINELMKEMNSKGFPTNLDVTNAILDACMMDGNICKAEETFEALIQLGIQPDWRTYVSLIRIYGKVSLAGKSLETFGLMTKNGILPNFSAYEAIIEVMGNALERNHVEELLNEAEDSGCKPMQPLYHAAMRMYLNLKMYKEVESIYETMKAADIRPTKAISNVLLTSFIQSGQLEKAEFLFTKIKEQRGIGVNKQTYNIMLEAYGGHHLKQKEALLIQEMQEKGFQVEEQYLNCQTSANSSVNMQAVLNMKMEKINDELREIIAGILLGGADAMSLDNEETFELHLQFNPERRTAYFLKEHLRKLFLRVLKPEYQSENGQEGAFTTSKDSGKLWRLETVSHASFRLYALQYRHKSKPVIPRLIHRWLKPCTLAYWYMYGGSKCQTTGGIILDGAKYSQKEIQHVVQVLEVRTSDCKIRKSSNGCSIRFEGPSSLLLWKKMEPHILEELKEDLMPCDVHYDIANPGWKNEMYDENKGDDHEDKKIDSYCSLNYGVSHMEVLEKQR